MAPFAASRLRRYGVRHLHVHFANAPSSVALLATRLAGISFSFTAHAYDIFVDQQLLPEKLTTAAFVACISRFNLHYLEQRYAAATGARLRLVRNGVDPQRFPPLIREPILPPMVIAVGRLMETKGFHVLVLVEAMARLREKGRDVSCIIAGDGPEAERLQRLINEMHLADRISLLGRVQIDHGSDSHHPGDAGGNIEHGFPGDPDGRVDCGPGVRGGLLVGRWLEGINVRRAQQVICISEVLKGYLMRYGVPALKLQVIPNGVDHHAFAPGDPDESLKERLALQHRVVIGYIGSFEFFAGVPGFMAMTKAICEADRRVVFLFVGEGQARLEIQHGAAALGLQKHFRFIGRVPHDQVPAYLRVMDIVVSPYRHEYLFYNSPMKLLEYMAMGKATVSTALGQVKEVVADGVNGMLYEPENYDTMSAKLLELVRTPKLRQQLGINARKTIERNWTWDLQAARLARVLQQARASGPA